MPDSWAHRLQVKAERWFDRARAALLNEIPCRRGCDTCCIGPFAITILDVGELHRGLASLDPVITQTIQARARTQAEKIEAMFPRLRSSPYLDDWADQAVDSLVHQFSDLPCPALHHDGSCGVYPYRPITCRMMGISVEKNGIVQGACEVQTCVPIRRLSRPIREEERQLAEEEEEELQRVRTADCCQGEEVLIAYGFLPDRIPLNLRET